MLELFNKYIVSSVFKKSYLLLKLAFYQFMNMIIKILTLIFFIFQVMFEAQVESSKIDSAGLSSSEINSNEGDFTLRSGAPCQKYTIIGM